MYKRKVESALLKAYRTPVCKWVAGFGDTWIYRGLLSSCHSQTCIFALYMVSSWEEGVEEWEEVGGGVDEGQEEEEEGRSSSCSRVAAVDIGAGLDTPADIPAQQVIDLYKYILPPWIYRGWLYEALTPRRARGPGRTIRSGRSCTPTTLGLSVPKYHSGLWLICAYYFNICLLVYWGSESSEIWRPNWFIFVTLFSETSQHRRQKGFGITVLHWINLSARTEFFSVLNLLTKIWLLKPHF